MKKVKRNLSLVSCNRDVYPEMLKESVCCSVGCQGYQVQSSFADGVARAAMYDLIHVGHDSLLGEII
ncbi:hypothetical protein C5167_035349 [Papaver somniferum]|uniref:Uncharacterized protein n=1 Tax=Papaver somniferum TaxID=3469 RepID=A0A4Y7KJN9_PAPSO|nr:hypothetical protein C5167_035349 [Papaver somniferum]